MYPLSSPQMGVYAGWAAYPQTTGYNLPSVVPFPRTIDADRLAAALQRIADSREVFHTRICTDSDGRPCQYADMQMPVRVKRMRMSDDEALHFIYQDFVRPFAIDGSEPLARFAVIETPQFHYLLIDMHHVIADGLTIVHSLLGIDLPRAYQGLPLLPATGSLYQMADEEQARCLTDDYQRAAEHQRARFRDVPFARLSEESSEAWGATLRRSSFLDRQRVDEWCAVNGLTPNLLWLGAFGLVMARWCRQRRIAFTVINHGRRGRQYADAYGMFVRSAPVIADMCGARAEPHAGSATVIDYVRSMRSELNSTIRYAAYPFTHFCRDMEVTPDVAFGFQATVQELVSLDGCSVQGWQLPPPMTRNDLSCMVYVTDNQYEVRMESSEALNSAFTLQALADAVVWTAGNMMAHPEARLADIAIVSEAEGQRLLTLSQGEKMEYDENDTFLRLFLRQAALTPDAVAVTDASGSLTYHELAERTAEKAAQWTRQGYAAGDIIPVKAEQTQAFLIAVIAAWRIGACIEVRGMGQEVISGQGAGSKGQENTHQTDYCLHSSTPPLLHSPNNLLHSPNVLLHSSTPSLLHSPNLAYIMYTSGSTGTPKGVMVSQRALTHFIHFIVRAWRLTSQSQIACHASVAFDASVEDLFPVLTTGGQLFIVPEPIRRDPDRLFQYLIDHGITGCCMTTQWGVMMAERYDLPLDYLCLGGERLMVAPHCRGRVFNTYGPTEMTVDATYYELQPGRHYDTIPIGRPLPDLSAYVVDVEGHLLPQGATGELWLAGPQMAEGYWGDAALTAQKFTACRFTEGRVYHTGDLARWNDEGLLEFMGRIDRQVKLRGYRIEPGQVECALLRIPGVQQAVVVVRPVGGQEQLCAYFSANRVITPAEMKTALSAALPAYMVPVAYLQMDRLPVTSSDKVDTDALPAITGLTSEADYVAPTTELERQWCGIFARVLGIERVGVTDDFFALGGTSLTAIHLLTAAAEQGLRLTYDQIFEHPTVASLVQVASMGQGAGCKVHENTTSTSRDAACRVRQEVASNTTSNIAHSTFDVPHSTFDVPHSTFDVPHSTFLTGATGFLGIHVLWELLGRGCHVVCLVRATDDKQAFARLLDVWQWYFPDSPNPSPSTLTAIAADITAPSLASMSLVREGTGAGLLIHCAADVRQYAPGDQLHRTNVEGTRHVIDFCLRHHLHMTHISTISLGQEYGRGQASGRELLFGRLTPYLLSKAEAENVVTEAVREQGLHAQILRVGNLTARQRDGVFQRYSDTNAFYALSQALQTMGCYPATMADVEVDMSPVDLSAQWVADALARPFDGSVEDVSNPEKTTVGVIARRWHLSPVSSGEFAARLHAAPLTDLQRFMLTTPK